MPRAYTGDMRQRVVAEVESGASRREAAEEFEVSASTAIIWVKCFRESGRCMPKPRGGSISPLEKHAHFLLDLIEQQPDLTLDEVVLAMHKRKIECRRISELQRSLRAQSASLCSPGPSVSHASSIGVRTSGGHVSMRVPAVSPPFNARTNSVRSQFAMSRTAVSQGSSAATAGCRGSDSFEVGSEVAVGVSGATYAALRCVRWRALWKLIRHSVEQNLCSEPPLPRRGLKGVSHRSQRCSGWGARFRSWSDPSLMGRSSKIRASLWRAPKRSTLAIDNSFCGRLTECVPTDRVRCGQGE